jgi:hypothetical protein
MTAPAIIHDLVNRFRDSRELYRSGRYNEAQLRQEFLNPLFETLGWDMYNRSNFAPQYREVIHEDSLEDEGSLKAPDYAFRIGTTRKFFVEAKKPAVDIRYAIHPAYQLRRYAWNAHLPLSILTDFEELAVYDCRTRPDPQDSAATGRVMLFTFEDYLTRWDELAQIFSKDAVWNGSFDRYAEGSKGKRGTTEVDAEFLKEIEQWRLLLARNIALRNFRSSVIASEAKQSLESTTDKYPPPTPPPNASLEGAVNETRPNISLAGSAPLTPSSPSVGREEGDEGGGSLNFVPASLSTEKMETIRSNPVRGGDTGTNSRSKPVLGLPTNASGVGVLRKTGTNRAKQPLNLHRAERQLNYAVQTTIDRILFLRICEDRQIEPTDQLLQIAEGSELYAQLLLLFQKADQKYNSGLFHFNKEKTQTSEPDTFTPTLQIDDKVLRQIIKSTYFPCPYIFNEIPVEILGQVYEQFLGSVIRLTPGGQAKVEEKPEVRKAGGVYYTPRYIVDYIVENTVGRLLGGSTVGETCHGLPASFQDPPPSSPSLRPKEGLEGVGSSRSLPGETSTNINSQQSGVVSSTPSSAAMGGGLGSGSFGLLQNQQMETIRSKPVLGQETGTITNSLTPSGDGLASFTPSSLPLAEGGGLGGGSFNQLQKDPSLTPAEALKLRVVDPACGSGSFLLGAYQYLLDWHLNYYLTHDPQSHTQGKNPPLVATDGGEYRLTTETKKRILTSNIHGVDIDAQAVEVTKLSLLLKLLEGETGQLTLGFERVLPDLGQNIRCGNSLIGWDYFQGQMFPDEEEIQRVNPFDWQRAFSHVFAEGGFDAVIGNPPYIRQESLGDDKRYYQSIYEVFTGTADIYSYFIEKGVKLLTPGGQFSYIVANKWLRAKYGFKLRQWLKTRCIEEIADFGDLPVFTGATTYPLILRISNNPPHFLPRVTTVNTLDFVSLQEYVDEHGENADQTCFEEDGWSLAGKATQNLLAKIRQNSIPLGEYVNGKVYRGILTGLNKAFVIDQATKDRLIAEDPRSAELIKPFAQGRDVKRYTPIPVKQYLIFTRRGVKINNYPAIKAYLSQFKEELMPKPANWKGPWKGRKPGKYQWYEIQDAIDYHEEFSRPKIVYPNICKQPEFTFDETGIYTNQKTFIIPTDDLYLLGILNSSLSMFLFTQMFPKLRGDFYEPGWVFFQNFPIHVIDPSNPVEVQKKDQIIILVQKALEMHRNNPTTPLEQTQLKHANAFTDRSIDQLVFCLYGLTKHERVIIENKHSSLILDRRKIDI